MEFINCTPRRFRDQWDTNTRQFIIQSFAEFSDKEKVDFVSVLYASFNRKIEQYRRSNGSYQKEIDDLTKERDHWIKLLGAQNIEPQSIAINRA
jgi:hypothetical protein